MCYCSNLYHAYNNNYNRVTITSLFLSAYNLFASHIFSLFFSHAILLTAFLYSLHLHIGDLWTHNFTQDWLNYHWLSSALSCPFIVQQDPSNKHSWSWRFAYSPCHLFIPHVCCCWFRCSIYLLVVLLYIKSGLEAQEVAVV